MTSSRTADEGNDKQAFALPEGHEMKSYKKTEEQSLVGVPLLIAQIRSPGFRTSVRIHEFREKYCIDLPLEKFPLAHPRLCSRDGQARPSPPPASPRPRGPGQLPDPLPPRSRPALHSDSPSRVFYAHQTALPALPTVFISTGNFSFARF